MNSSLLNRAASAALGTTVLAGGFFAGPASAATIYSNNFSGVSAAGFSNSYADLTTATAGPASLTTFPSSNTGSYTINQPGPTLGASGAYASISLAGLPTVSASFTESETVFISAATDVPAAGLRVLATDTTEDHSAYWADISVSVATGTTGFVRIYGQNSGGASTNYVLTSIPNFALNTLYDLSVTGTYDGSGNLVLSVTATQDNNTLNTVTGTTTSLSGASLYAGHYFGIRQSAGSASTITATYDDFQVTATPEPATMGILMVASIGLCTRRRRPIHR